MIERTVLRRTFAAAVLMMFAVGMAATMAAGLNARGSAKGYTRAALDTSMRP